jgi:hypothetical protein
VSNSHHHRKNKGRLFWEPPFSIEEHVFQDADSAAVIRINVGRSASKACINAACNSAAVFGSVAKQP